MYNGLNEVTSPVVLFIYMSVLELSPKNYIPVELYCILPS
jgi:hypothetical protein